MIRIRKVSVHAFRGIVDLDLSLEGNNLILKGENGTGKSSIVEAIEFFFTGSLTNFTGIEGLSLQKHAGHRNFFPSDVSIKVSFNPGDITLERSFYRCQQPPDVLLSYFEDSKKGAFILRRSQILEFIISKPAEKFRAIASILGIEQLDNVELSMKRAYDDLKDALISKKAFVDGVYSNISTQLGQRVTSSNDALWIINSNLSVVGLSAISSLKDVSQISAEFSKGFKQSIDLERITKLAALLQEVEQFKIDPAMLHAINLTAVELDPLLVEQAHENLLFRDFLFTGQDALEMSKSELCPLCGQEIEREAVLNSVRNRLQTLNELANKTETIRYIISETEGRISLILNTLQSITVKFATVFRIR